MEKPNEEIYIIDEHERGKLIAMARGFIGCNREKDGFFAEEYIQFLNRVANKKPVEVIGKGKMGMVDVLSDKGWIKLHFKVGENFDTKKLINIIQKGEKVKLILERNK